MVGDYLYLFNRILIVEENPDMQLRVQRIMEELGCGLEKHYYSQTLSHAVKISSKNKIDLFIIDLQLPDGNGVDLINIIRKDLKYDVPIMVISEWDTLDTVYQALESGANGYILKEKQDVEIIYAIKMLLKGEAIIDTSIAKKILQKIHQKKELNLESDNKNMLLSRRELQILKFIENGCSSKEIGENIHISRFTVNVHIRNIFQKLKVNSRTKAIYAARNEGLLV